MNLDLETRLLEDLSDEAAFAVCELLNELVQIRRYHSAKQADLFDPLEPWKRRDTDG
jgi:hypothetical protein